MSLLPKPTLTDYTFLKTPKNRSYFILSRQKAARDHVKRKWSNQNGTTKTPRQAFEVTHHYDMSHLSSLFLFFRNIKKLIKKENYLIQIESKLFTKFWKSPLPNGRHFDRF